MQKEEISKQNARLAKAVTDLAVNMLNVKSEWVTVLFEEFERENWVRLSSFLHSENSAKGTERKPGINKFYKLK
jgi:4-oxalocrotonate tautomerase